MTFSGSTGSQQLSIEMAGYAAWSAARQWQGTQKSLASACGGLGLRPASQCHFDAFGAGISV
jgi:hypothetical protein